ncbi:MAG: hypothetical protein R2788_17190 [Saprospiraceae bacterium]
MKEEQNKEEGQNSEIGKDVIDQFVTALNGMESRLGKVEKENKRLITKLKLKEGKSMILTWLPLILSAIAIYATVTTNWNRTELAMKSGSLDKGELELKLGNYALNKNKKSIIYVVNELDSPNDSNLLFLSFPFTVFNKGLKNLEDCILTYQYPNINGNIAIDAEKYFKKSETPLEAKRNFYGDEKYDQIVYKINKIQPKNYSQIYELTCFRNSLIESEFEGYDNDSLPVNVKYKAGFGYESFIKLTADNHKALTFDLEYYHVNKKDYNFFMKESDLLEKIINHKDEYDLYLITDANKTTKVKLSNGEGTVSQSEFDRSKILKLEIKE